MPGSAGDPVRLDPFRRIVEVGWGAMTHLAFSIAIDVNYSRDAVFDPPPDPGLGNRPVITAEQYVSGWAQQFFTAGSETYDFQKSATSPVEVRAFRSGRWVAISAASMVIDGGLPPFSHTSTSDIVSVFTNDYFPLHSSPHGLWTLTPGGAGGGLHVPGRPDKPFAYGTSPKVYMEYNAIRTEGDYWASTPGLGVQFGSMSAHQVTPIIDKVYPVSGMLVRYRGKAFRGVATAVANADDLWILCERSAADE